VAWTLDSGWKLVRDVCLTATGLVLIVLQSVSAHPNDSVLITGLALTGIGASFHIGSLMSGQFGMHASQPPPGQSSQPLPQHAEAGEHGSDDHG
jgi:hypothetical protein